MMPSIESTSSNQTGEGSAGDSPLTGGDEDPSTVDSVNEGETSNVGWPVSLTVTVILINAAAYAMSL